MVPQGRLVPSPERKIDNATKYCAWKIKNIQHYLSFYTENIVCEHNIIKFLIIIKGNRRGVETMSGCKRGGYGLDSGK